jgi:hypothetical protein
MVMTMATETRQAYVPLSRYVGVQALTPILQNNNGNKNEIGDKNSAGNGNTFNLPSLSGILGKRGLDLTKGVTELTDGLTNTVGSITNPEAGNGNSFLGNGNGNGKGNGVRIQHSFSSRMTSC